MRWGDDDGSSTVFSFIVATSIFALAFTSVTYFASDYIAEHSAESESLDAVAAAALAVLNSNPGIPSTWDASSPPDRLGMLKTGTTTTMDGTKLAALASWSGNRQRYDEARGSLGLDDYNIRIRSYPTFTVTSEGVTGLEEQRVAYLAPADQVVVDEEVPALDRTGVVFDTRNADADLSDGYTPGDVFTSTHAALNTYLAPRLHGFLAAHDGAQVVGAQTYWRVLDETGMDGGTTTRVLTTSIDGGSSWSYGSSLNLLNLNTPLDRILLTEVDFSEGDLQAGDAVTVELDHWLSGWKSTPLANDVVDDYGLIQFYCTAGCTPNGWATAARRLDSEGSEAAFATRTVDVVAAGIVPSGAKGYLALAWHSYDDGDPAHNGQGWFLRSVKVTTTVGGESEVWDNQLDMAQSLYDAVVVGSQVAQAQLNDPADPAFDRAFKAWITQGGDLVVTGSNSAATPWLLDLASGVTTKGTLGLGLYEDRTDTTHAMLNNPHRLRWTSYSTALTTYDLPSNPALGEPFADVVHHVSQTTNQDEAFLSVSSANWRQTYGGVAVVTAYQPFGMGPVEATRFYSNALVFAEFNDLQVDFGEQVPSGRDVGTAQRSVVVDARNAGLGFLEGEMVVHVWR